MADSAQNRLDQLLATTNVVVLDGAMGTMLFDAGLVSGASPEEWNISHPDRIRAVHRHYIHSGSHIILTNSFGGSRYRLKLHNLQDRVFELNRAAAKNARAEADAADRLVLVGGSIGPTGELLKPMGNMEFDEAKTAFAEQAKGLVAGGVDLLWVETMSDLEEVRAAVEGIRSVTDLPICATMSFDTNGRTMMGVTPARAVRAMKQWGLAGIGGNCGNGIAEIEHVIYAMHREAPEVRLIAKANAGIPQWRDNELFYDATPSVMGRYAQRVRALGASFVGGCCGNGPDHIAAISEALQSSISEVDLAALMAEQAAYDGPSDEVVTRDRARRRHRE
ncbi:MAG: betaine--homocysteine S-methyltransferase [Anaerolineae bacterium]|nr:betaine--homocysteine S-methyltransferase [Promineifilum sp.]MCZ2114148.1 betaine--homocysteine S-methyltransferase [Anaerolineae bacterium]